MLRRLPLVWLLTMATLFQAHATSLPAKLYADATMTVKSASYGFEGLTTATLSLSMEDGDIPTTMTLGYGDKVAALTVQTIDSTGDGTTTYWATLPDGNPNGVRFSIWLWASDANDQKTWQATVRQGWGWCGTMDATMELEGVPVHYLE